MRVDKPAAKGHPSPSSALSDGAQSHRVHAQVLTTAHISSPREAEVMNQAHPGRHNVGTGSIWEAGPETRLQASYLQYRTKVYPEYSAGDRYAYNTA